jgi:tRNA G18 (ribose-2'-O)-methylase SpoU
VPFSAEFRSREKKICFSFGNEVHGVSKAVALCDGCIEIPQLGTKHSLNISVSAGIAVWVYFKKILAEVVF